MGVRRIALASFLASLLAGCFSVTADLRADGSGTLTLAYFPPRHATIRSETRRLSSDHVTLRSLRVVDHRTEVVLVFDDVSKLPTAEAFREVTVEQTRDDHATRLRIGIPVPRLPDLPSGASDGQSPGQLDLDARISITLPGQVLRAEPEAAVGNGGVAWHVPMATFKSLSVLELSVRYVPPPGPPTPPPATVPPIHSM